MSTRPPAAPVRIHLWFYRLALLAAGIAAWWLFAARMPGYIMPTPDKVAHEIVRLAGTPTFLTDVGITLGRVAAGFFLALIIGTPLGILLGSSRFLGAVFEPILPIVNTVSSAIWAILAILWFGLSGFATIFVVFMTALPLIVTNVWQGAHNVNADLVEVARSLRMRRSAVLAKIFLPSILPYLFSGSRLAFGFGWRVSLVAETLGSSAGIGYRLRQAADLLQIGQVFAWTVVLVTIMALLELGVLQPLERRLFRWRKAAA
jgi:ABC-type nitrate/sulfonate/bicarbonate transport system, permease component